MFYCSHNQCQFLFQIFSKVSSLGLNEQEMLLIAQLAGGPHSSLASDQGGLDIEKVGDTVHWLLSQFSNPTRYPKSRLSRVHFHTLSFHMTAARTNVWGNQLSATGAGARVAGSKACAARKLHPSMVDLKIPLEFSLHAQSGLQRFDARQPIVSWVSAENITLIFSPVLVCKKPTKTVGLGDAISSTGLLYSTLLS